MKYKSSRLGLGKNRGNFLKEGNYFSRGNNYSTTRGSYSIALENKDNYGRNILRYNIKSNNYSGEFDVYSKIGNGSSDYFSTILEKLGGKLDTGDPEKRRDLRCKNCNRPISGIEGMSGLCSICLVYIGRNYKGSFKGAA